MDHLVALVNSRDILELFLAGCHLDRGLFSSSVFITVVCFTATSRPVMNRYTPTFVFLLMCLMVVLVNWRCATGGTTVGWTDSGAPVVDGRTYPLLDYNGIKHQYKGDVSNFTSPKHNRKLTQYCSVHFEWEDIQARWSQDKLAEPGNHRWNYYVSKNKKSWK